jgi:predicted metalloprotease with PDZ domain
MVLRFLMLAAVAAQLPAQTPVHARVRLGFSVDSGRMLVVREMAVPSAASRAGLRVQDTLVAINGRPATWNVLVDVSDRLRVRDTVQLDVRSIGSPRRVILVVDDARLPFVRVRATVLDTVGVIGSLLDSIDVMMSRRGPGCVTDMCRPE